MVLTPTFAFSASQTASGALPHHHLHGLPVPDLHYQSYCVRPEKMQSIAHGVSGTKHVLLNFVLPNFSPQLKQDL